MGMYRGLGVVEVEFWLRIWFFFLRGLVFVYCGWLCVFVLSLLVLIIFRSDKRVGFDSCFCFV